MKTIINNFLQYHKISQIVPGDYLLSKDFQERGVYTGVLSKGETIHCG